MVLVIGGWGWLKNFWEGEKKSKKKRKYSGNLLLFF